MNIISLLDSFERGLSSALEVLSGGGVVAHPTDTCYGFAVDIFQEKALDRLYALKRMSRFKPVSIMVSSLDEAERYGIFENVSLKLARESWPGPVTLIVPRRDILPFYFNKGLDSVGIRVPAHEFCFQLVQGFGQPVTTTSANISGKPPVYDVQDLYSQFSDATLQPDLVLDGGILPYNSPSKIFEFRDGKLVQRR